MTVDDNIATLDSFLNLKDNWNEYGAKPFDKEFIEKIKEIIPDLIYQPEIFPTGRNSIQLEYTGINSDMYLEFELCSDDTTNVYIQDGAYERTSSFETSVKSINKFLLVVLN